MIGTLTLVLVALLLLLGPVVAVFAAQMVLALLPARPDPATVLARRCAVLVPAHDEAALIRQTVAALLAELGPSDRLLVVADNCSDDTAAIARAAGAEVVERQDRARRGKGYALDFGIHHLARGARPDVIVIIDADCGIDKGGIARLSSLCVQTGRPVQAAYSMLAPPGALSGLRIAAFACEIKTVARPLGWWRAGLPCLLSGTGMALPWDLAPCIGSAPESIVEDLELGIRLALAGRPPLFCPDVTVTSTLPSNDMAHHGQKTRWIHGHLATIVRFTPLLLATACRRAEPALVATAADLTVPPLSTLVAALIMASSLSGLWAAFTGEILPLHLAMLELAVLLLALLLGLIRFGRGIVQLRDLLSIPAFGLRKMLILMRFFTRRELAWVRTDRGGPAAPTLLDGGHAPASIRSGGARP